jgi:DNA modification methylase
MNLLINADARQIPLADGSVNCIVTSPPYYGLRDYGTARWEGGDPNCDHNPQRHDGGWRADRTLPLGRGGVYREVCAKCGAIRIDSQIGLEQTPQEYVDNLVQVFKECWRILRDDGTVWLNLGDSYSSYKDCKSVPDTLRVGGKSESANMIEKGKSVTRNTRAMKSVGLKDKDLIGIPWMVAFALRDDGWYLRQDIIWSKPNPMPESVKDRTTKAHEYIFLLSKSPKYYYDYEAIAEPSTESTIKRYGHRAGNKDDPNVKINKYSYSQSAEAQAAAFEKANSIIAQGKIPMRNKRSVWAVATKAYKGAHFATYPPELIEPCILAGCPELICSKCGAPWVRDLEREDKRHWTERNEYSKDGKYEFEYLKTKSPNQVGRNDAQASYKSPKFIDHGLKPTCNCGAEPISGVVFDPFAGSGTTVAVANSLGRRGIGIDLNYNYLQLAQERVGKVQLPLV